jgi:hypothetical protein
MNLGMLWRVMLNDKLRQPGRLCLRLNNSRFLIGFDFNPKTKYIHNGTIIMLTGIL